MSRAIEASEKSVDRVFCQDYIFRIPVYQRPYAWESEQVEELFDDLVTAMRTGGDEPYFLGSIVLVKKDGMPNCDVVDGQQRLTTLTILLCVLREISEGDWKLSLDDRIRQKRDVVSRREEVVRLHLKESDQGYFRRYVQNEGGISNLLSEVPSGKTDSQERISENTKYLYKQAEKLSEEQRETLASFIINHCYLVVVATTSQSSAFRVFSVMNDRGLDLTATDILKAEITGSMEKDQFRATYARKWEDIEESLGRNRFVDLFSHIRMIYAKDKSRSNLQDEFRDQVLSKLDGRQFVDEVLVPYADAYENTLGINDGVSEEIRRYLKHLSRLDNVDWIPPAMATFFAAPKVEGNLLRIVRGLERLAYGLFIRRANVNERIRRFATVIHAVQRGDAEAVWKALELSTEEKLEIIDILDGQVYKMTRVRKPLLLRLDGLLADSEATYDHSVITIEHVLPQNPQQDSEWLKWFPDEEERENWTHRLANLVLLSRRKNTRASNFEFRRKKEEYFARGGISPFPLTTGVLQEDQWIPKVLEQWQALLLKLFKDEWRL